MTEQQIDHSISLEIHANSDDYSLYSRVHELECDKAEAECKLADALAENAIKCCACGRPARLRGELEQQLDAANRQIEKLSAWKKQAIAVLSGIAAAMDAGMTDADQRRYLGRGSDYVIADLWDRVRSGEAAERKLSSALLSSALALKQISEDRDQFAAAVEEARRRLEHIQNCSRPPTMQQEQFIFNLQANASTALVNIADPVECLKARDAEIRQKTIREMGRNGGRKGAATVNGRLTPEERRESARKAAIARWNNREADGQENAE